MRFLLPSGRALELHEPFFGDQIHIAVQTWENAEELLYAKCAVIVPELTRDEIFHLTPADGHALISEVGRLWDGERPKVAGKPSKSGSASRSTASNRKRRTQRRA